MLQHPQLLCTYLHPADAGANFVRPYNFLRNNVLFCKTPLQQI